jgi:hypothetical protein
MPYEVHPDAVKKATEINIMADQVVVPDTLPDNWTGTRTRGLPVRQIPTYLFPCVVYKHPRRPHREVVHRNAQHEVVEIERIPTDHISKLVGCSAHLTPDGPVWAEQCKACDKALEVALAEGWVTKPYIPEPLPVADADLYDEPKTAPLKK